MNLEIINSGWPFYWFNSNMKRIAILVNQNLGCYKNNSSIIIMFEMLTKKKKTETEKWIENIPKFSTQQYPIDRTTFRVLHFFNVYTNIFQHVSSWK